MTYRIVRSHKRFYVEELRLNKFFIQSWRKRSPYFLDEGAAELWLWNELEERKASSFEVIIEITV